MEGGAHLPTSFCHQGLHPQAQLGEGAPLEENHTPWGPVGACLSQRILGVFWVEVPMPVVGWQLGRCGNQSAGLWGLQCQQTAPSLLCGVPGQLVNWGASPTAHGVWQWSKAGQDSWGPGDHTSPATGVSARPQGKLPGVSLSTAWKVF